MVGFRGIYRLKPGRCSFVFSYCCLPNQQPFSAYIISEFFTTARGLTSEKKEDCQIIHQNKALIKSSEEQVIPKSLGSGALATHSFNRSVATTVHWLKFSSFHSLNLTPIHMMQ